MIKNSRGLNLVQNAWVVKDITVAKKNFEDTMVVSNFNKVETGRAKDYEATYYGKSSMLKISLQ